MFVEQNTYPQGANGNQYPPQVNYLAFKVIN